MIVAIWSLALLTGEPFILLGQDGSAKLEFDEASVSREAGSVEMTVRVTPSQDRGYAVSQADVRIDCRAQTITWLALRAYDAAGGVLKAVEIPEQDRTAAVLYRDDPLSGLYTRYCEGVLPAAPPSAPPPVAVLDGAT